MTTPKDIPLMFTPDNRAAVRSGIKTETRRLMKPQPDPGAVRVEHVAGPEWWWWPCIKSVKVGIFKPDAHASTYGCPQYEPVRYWMREPVRVIRRDGLISAEDVAEGFDEKVLILYEDDGRTEWKLITEKDGQRLDSREDWARPTSTLHMLKSFTRTWLTGRRAWPEKLGDITPEGAISEGIEVDPDTCGIDRSQWSEHPVWRDYLNGGYDLTPVQSYVSLWESIHGVGSWHPQRWVWVVQWESKGAV